MAEIWNTQGPPQPMGPEPPPQSSVDKKHRWVEEGGSPHWLGVKGPQTSCRLMGEQWPHFPGAPPGFCTSETRREEGHVSRLLLQVKKPQSPGRDSLGVSMATLPPLFIIMINFRLDRSPRRQGD